MHPDVSSSLPFRLHATAAHVCSVHALRGAPRTLHVFRNRFRTWLALTLISHSRSRMPRANGHPAANDDDEPPKKRKKAAVKKEASTELESTPQPKKAPKKADDGAGPSSPKKKKSKKEDEDGDEEEVFKWWEQGDPNGDGSVKWQTLEHSGVLFPPPYEPLPSTVKMNYNGTCFYVSQLACIH